MHRCDEPRLWFDLTIRTVSPNHRVAYRINVPRHMAAAQKDSVAIPFVDNSQKCDRVAGWDSLGRLPPKLLLPVCERLHREDLTLPTAGTNVFPRRSF